MIADQFVHSERDLVAALGLTQKAVRVVRADELEQKSDWAMVHGEVRYSDAGKAKLLSLLKISVEPPQAAPAPALEKKSAGPFTTYGFVPEQQADGSTVLTLSNKPRASVQGAAKELAPAATVRTPGAREDLTCFKIYSRNTRIVEAKTAAGELVLVRVRENKNLKPGMVMKCRFGGGRIWELAQRLPRYRGRW